MPPRLATEVTREVQHTWDACNRAMQSAHGGRPTPDGGRTLLTLRAAPHLPALTPVHAGPGIVEARLPEPLDEEARWGLRHEVAHQFLHVACPAAQQDALFQEAFALTISGELGAWGLASEGPYLSEMKSVALLRKDPQVQTRDARRALARLLEGGEKTEGMHRVVWRQLAACAAGAVVVPLTPEQLVTREGIPTEPAFVLLSRHSGEVIAQSGPIDTLVPPGSTLKPFLVARSRRRPGVAVVPAHRPAEWECEWPNGHPVTWQEGLARSCNGYFLDAIQPRGAVLGVQTPLLEAVGMEGRAHAVADAIGLTRNLQLSPRMLAQAYRALSFTSPDVIQALREVPRQGTLSELPDSAWAASLGLAMKTGTVRDLESRPVLGWVVAVSDDVIAVLMTPGQAPRDTLDALHARWPDAQKLAPHAAVKVQVFGLLPSESITLRCASGAGVWIRGRSSFKVVRDVWGWSELARPPRARFLCLTSDVMASFPGLDGERPYLGMFSRLALPPGGGPGNTRAARARRGSEIVFTTTRLRYALGVLNSEDAQARGPVRDALLHVVDFNVRHSRHAGRPVCDTTHCQVFQGTPGAPDAVLHDVAELLTRGLAARQDWLPFSKGGDAPWERLVPRREIESRLRRKVQHLERSGGDVVMLDPSGQRARLPCEVVRNTLQLLSCPDVIERAGDGFLFRGRGEGHGMGMDVERLKRDPTLTTEEDVLRRAYRDAVWLQ